MGYRRVARGDVGGTPRKKATGGRDSTQFQPKINCYLFLGGFTNEDSALAAYRLSELAERESW
jgi:hypothetical protein